MRAHSTTVDPKCDILFVPDGVLGAGEAMRRREFIAFVGSTAVARSQQGERMRRIGFPAGGARPVSLESSYFGGLLQGLRELGYVEGRDFVMEWRFAEGRNEIIPALAAELVRSNVDVIVLASSRPFGRRSN
jgi:putative tryptophan/tyrosine transport system substrate-binding protein